MRSGRGSPRPRRGHALQSGAPPLRTQVPALPGVCPRYARVWRAVAPPVRDGQLGARWKRVSLGIAALQIRIRQDLPPAAGARRETAGGGNESGRRLSLPLVSVLS